ncbi:outer membrane beta-barrel protein [Sphingobacterium sp.]|uniref:outer membrane beta-barrel protein n=1 Tax=Sphingobacterium sp. TaxID=341027 RepID=UPI002899A80F|nr:outer membrane beta-barrel protein [Sphingobacterium sp.]
MSNNLWLYLLLFFPFSVKSQEQITKKVVDAETKQRIMNAEVSIVRSESHQVINILYTDSLGQFKLNNLSENFYIKIQKTGYETNERHGGYEFSIIELKPEAKRISEVVINVSKRNLKLNESNIIMAVASNKDFRTATNLLDVLRKTPGVSIDQDGGIVLGGRTAPAVFINGRPVIMTNQELQGYLKSLSPEMVESLEINSNPSAQYDSEFKGIIDIRLKKNENIGWNGNYNGNIHFTKFNTRENSLNLSYNTAKITYSLQSAYNSGISAYKYSAIQKLADENIMKTGTYQKEDAGLYNIRSGVDYRLNDNNRIIFNLKANFTDTHRSRDGALIVTDKGGKSLSNTKSENPALYSQNSYGAAVDYSYQNKGFKAVFLGNYLFVNNKQKDDFINKDVSNAEPLSYWKSDMLNRINFYRAQADFSQKIRNAELEAGIKYSHSDTHNNIRYDTLSADSNFELDSSRSNLFFYYERISAGYFSYKQKWKEFQINAGIRAEYTYSISDAITIDSNVTRKYMKFLPSFSAVYKINVFNELSFSYSRKITRPVFSQLNPFRFYFSPLNYWIGNPYLQPSLTSQFRISYRYKSWITSFTTGKEKDVMTRYPLYHPETNVLEYLGTNLPYRNFVSLESSFPMKITKWWNITGQLAGYYNYEFRPYLSEVFALEIYNYEIRMNQIFSLPKGFHINLFGNYESRTGNSLYIIKPRYVVDISTQKSWLNNKLNTKISYNNIFDSYKQRLGFRHKQIMDNRFSHWTDSRRLILSLSYSFGSSKYQTKEQQKTDEENRVR